MNQPAHFRFAKAEPAQHISENVQTSLSADGRTFTIGIVGEFSFGLHQAFREAYETNPVSVEHYVVNLESVTSLDNSVLGMLLLLHDYAKQRKASLRISNILPAFKRQFAPYGFMLPFAIA